jgi:hypothetical protein
LEDVLGAANPDDRHGRTSHLGEDERRKLAAYLRQLDGLDENGAGIAARAAMGGGAGRLILRPAGGVWSIEWRGAPERPAALFLHDPAGRTVRVLRAREATSGGPDGDWRWIWDGRSRGGEPVPPGALILRACAGSDCIGGMLPRP